MVEQVLAQDRSIALAAEAAGVSERTCAKWVTRYRQAGPEGLLDRSSAPRRVHNRTDRRLVELLMSLRRLRFTAPELADLLDMPVSTISGILKREGMGRLGRLGMEPAVRYERERPGELIHIDVKKLGRIHGSAGHRATGRGAGRKQPRGTDALGVSPRHRGMGRGSRPLSMTPPAWPTSKFSPTRKPPPQSRSYAARSRSMSATASPSSA
jgi:hypothetical protein